MRVRMKLSWFALCSMCFQNLNFRSFFLLTRIETRVFLSQAYGTDFGNWKSNNAKNKIWMERALYQCVVDMRLFAISHSNSLAIDRSGQVHIHNTFFNGNNFLFSTYTINSLIDWLIKIQTWRTFSPLKYYFLPFPMIPTPKCFVLKHEFLWLCANGIINQFCYCYCGVYLESVQNLMNDYELQIEFADYM